MLGYGNDFSLYRIYKPSSGKVFRICNVKFDESIFPGLKNQEPDPQEDLFDLPTDSNELLADQDQRIARVELQDLQVQLPSTPQIKDSVSPNLVIGDVAESVAKAPRNINSAISVDNILS
ncbi:hypothetical protein H4Q26_008857, partial [Puccinia striiformis f. sp. tritici PST-130]